MYFTFVQFAQVKVIVKLIMNIVRHHVIFAF